MQSLKWLSTLTLTKHMQTIFMRFPVLTFHSDYPHFPLRLPQFVMIAKVATIALHIVRAKKKRILLINFLRKMKEINLFLLFLRYPDSMFQSSFPLFCSNGIRVAKVNPLKIW